MWIFFMSLKKKKEKKQEKISNDSDSYFRLLMVHKVKEYLTNKYMFYMILRGDSWDKRINNYNYDFVLRHKIGSVEFIGLFCI